ncbi:IMPACT family member C14C8.09c [Cyphellophora attinorum]|uniref:IMPACT family member C14C8.09c n=1 Tax=Cyphellophora attinorum TaxID=1664694 RepID=A0A0N1P1M6_9EURO|nr:IMPACT family member C14C8.09c [Phialophora attinorum]KPI42065.1 IMPACT family member C14C8.09c [Phialophora attinorum]
MPQKRQRSPPVDELKDSIFISDPIEDRSSTFIAYYSPTESAKSLQALPQLKSADHRMAAWRKPSAQKTIAGKSIFATGSDDDGEKYAGKKLEKVMAELDAGGAVVVARWYGGILLGPVRFTHIENVAKQAIARSRGVDTGAQPAKKPKQELVPVDDSADVQRLAKQLADRDKSIATLRQLLAEKQAEKLSDALPTSSGAQAATVAAQAPDYGAMSLTRLRQLEKARDATISWTLRQIDAAEASNVSNETG